MRIGSVIVLLAALAILAVGCGAEKRNESALRDIVSQVEKQAAKNPDLLGVVYTLRGELDAVRKAKFRENLKRDLDTKGAEGRAKYAETLKSLLGEERYRDLERIRAEAGYAELFN